MPSSPRWAGGPACDRGRRSGPSGATSRHRHQPQLSPLGHCAVSRRRARRPPRWRPTRPATPSRAARIGPWPFTRATLPVAVFAIKASASAPPVGLGPYPAAGAIAASRRTTVRLACAATPNRISTARQTLPGLEGLLPRSSGGQQRGPARAAAPAVGSSSGGTPTRRCGGGVGPHHHPIFGALTGTDRTAPCRTRSPSARGSTSSTAADQRIRRRRPAGPGGER